MVFFRCNVLWEIISQLSLESAALSIMGILGGDKKKTLERGYVQGQAEETMKLSTLSIDPKPLSYWPTFWPRVRNVALQCGLRNLVHNAGLFP